MFLFDKRIAIPQTKFGFFGLFLALFGFSLEVSSGKLANLLAFETIVRVLSRKILLQLFVISLASFCV